MLALFPFTLPGVRYQLALDGEASHAATGGTDCLMISIVWLLPSLVADRQVNLSRGCPRLSAHTPLFNYQILFKRLLVPASTAPASGLESPQQQI